MKAGNSIKLSAAILITAVFCLILAGCFSSKAKQSAAEVAAPAKKYDIIRLASPVDVVQTVNYWVGEELGFYEEEGIKLEYAGVVPSSQLVASVVAGKLDIGGAHVNRTIAGISAGAKIKAVVADKETSEEVPHMVFVTRTDSPLRTAQDLVGKKIGISTNGGCHEYTPYAYMKKNGIEDPKSKVQIIVMPETMMEQALRQGEIDVAGMHRNPNQVGDQPEFRVMFHDYQIWGTIGGATPVYFTEKFIKENPDLVRRFVRATAKTNNWCNANPDKAAEITAKRANIDPKTVKRTRYAPDGIIKDETVTVWIDLLRDFNEIKGDIKPAQIYTNEFNPYARN
ncbi:MAG: ABC transporter substrate-binding protein [Bacillota bacterium]